MSEPSPRAVLFDLDDTLHDRTQAGRLRAARWVDQYLPTNSPEERAESIEWLIALDNGGYGSKAEILRRLQERNPALGWNIGTFTQMFVEALFEHMTLTEDAEPLLGSLRANGIPWGIVTNGSPTQRDKVIHLGLDGLTNCVFVSGEFGSKKPDRRIFDAAAACLGIPSAQVLFVGDHAQNDIAGAAGAGMKTAWLSHGREWPTEQPTTPDYILTSLSDITTLLDLAIAA